MNKTAEHVTVFKVNRTVVRKRDNIKIGKKNVKIFKIKNRRGYAALCAGNLTEGRSPQQALGRMIKAVRRTGR